MADRPCSLCALGKQQCGTQHACGLPLPDEPARLRFGIEPHIPTSRSGWIRVFNVAIGFAMASFIVGAVGRHLNLF